MTITYICGEDNTAVDALSHLPPDIFPNKKTPADFVSVNAVLSITYDPDILKRIKDGYSNDEFCVHVSKTGMNGWTLSNGLWYIGDRLLIPHIPEIREILFWLAHDSLGHFGADKSYAALRDTYYWPNMCRDLEQSYIPFCWDCLRNKS